ncbi:MAG: hypothetical protein AAF998_24395 [Bacteroidota bacterium]
MLRSATLLALIVLTGFGVNAQSLTFSSVPARATQSFARAVPGTDPAWTQGPDQTFEASFTRSGRNFVYVYDQTGALQQKKQQATLGSLPAKISGAIASIYPGVKPNGAYKVITRTKQRYFEVVVPGRGTLDYMRFDVEGYSIGKSSLALAEPATPDPLESTPEPISPTIASAAVTPSESKPAYNPMPMRGESATTTPVDLSAEIDIEAEMMDDDIADLFQDDEEDLDALLDNNDSDDEWEDIDLLNLDDDDDDWENIDPNP